MQPTPKRYIENVSRRIHMDNFFGFKGNKGNLGNTHKCIFYQSNRTPSDFTTMSATPAL
jgi:hypothetical protein